MHSALKTSIVKPLYKSGLRTDFNNYRPISILSALSKAFEKCVCAQLCAHLENNKIFYRHQYGFRSFHSTTHAIVTFCNNIHSALDTDRFNLTVFIDLRKAFDTVIFGVLLGKLKHYGVRNTEKNWFHSYLTGRSQFTEVNGVRSSRRSVEYGVPQGSVAGPLLFLILVNDFYRAVDSDTILFADDTTMQVSGTQLAPLYERMNANLVRASAWFAANSLTLNESKTKYFCFSTRRQHCHNIELLINNCSIERIGSDCETKTFKFLGLNIDDSLSWKEHIQITKRKLYYGCFGLSATKNYLPLKARKLVYNSLIMSHLNYGNLAVGCANSPDINYLYNVQKKSDS